ncbi:MAG: phosphoenolpyruvate carboxylase [Bradymonadia bacterium]|jgi:phosphoenolpyruvate carboxylase
MREVIFSDKDLPLRHDVSELGAIVGSVLREQCGELLYEAVETARKAAIRRRQGDDSAEAELVDAVGALDPKRAEELVRGFATYFQVVNLAEQVHRIRRGRDYLREGGSQPRGLRAAFAMLRDGGMSREQVLELLASIRIEPVFTAHPTEATRRTILEKHQRIAKRLVERLDPSLTPPEKRVIRDRIRGEITTGWQTNEHPTERPTVADEREHVLFYVTDVLYRIIPPFYEAIEEALEHVFGAEVAPDELPVIVRFISWVGGDMDGNPNVDETTIKATLERQRLLILSKYFGEANELARSLSQSVHRVGVDSGIHERLVKYGALLPEVAGRLRPRHRDMLYRLYLTYVAERLQATSKDEPSAYATPDEFVADVELLERSLVENGGGHAGLFVVRRLLRRARTFGFHLATLDVRQDAIVHRNVIGRALGDDGWHDRPSEERATRIIAAIDENTPSGLDDAESMSTLGVFRAIQEARAKFGEHAIGPYIISMTRGADDVFAVLLLAKWAGLRAADGTFPLDVTPLLETVPDLQVAPQILLRMLRDPIYGPHLTTRERRQLVMIGYSDSNKDGGIAAARWALHEGQAAMVKAVADEDLHLTFFHGRGGTISRGGSNTTRAVTAAPAGSVAGHLRVTEQGETINSKYGLRAIAIRTLEQALGAVAVKTGAPEPEDARAPQWESIMAEIAALSRQTFRGLIYDDPDFFEYFQKATPIDVIGKMRIGSRPGSRSKKVGIGSLRAIPWVFSWMQSRHVLPGWYGLGSALEAAVETHGEAAIAAMTREWPFMGALTADVEMVLAKADLGIAARYAALAGEVGERIFPIIEAEYTRTSDWILRLRGISELLEHEETLQRSIKLRNPYVDPMSLLQVQLLKEWRATGSQDGELLAALLASVNGIAQGLRNTG